MIVVAGESLIDLIPDGPGQLIAHCGGGPFNTAQALARLGQRVSFLGSISDDALGLRLRARLVEAGVGVDTLIASSLPTTLAMAEIDQTGSAQYRFYTDATAAPALTAADALAALPPVYDALYVGGLGLALEPIADAIDALVQAASDAGALVMVDPNIRPSAIRARLPYLARLKRVLRRAHVVKVSVEDLAWLDPDRTPADAARALLNAGPRVVLLTRSAHGALVFTPNAAVTVAALPVAVVDTIGAGDAFSAGFLAWWRQRARGRDQLGDLDTVADAAGFASLVAGRACERAGAAAPRIDPQAFPTPAALPARQHIASAVTSETLSSEPQAGQHD
jgi:fructokinase